MDTQIYTGNIEEETTLNTNFRKVVYTGKLQLVLMSLKVNEAIGEEIHDEHDQFFRVEKGNARIIVNDKEYNLSEDDALIVPAGSKHNVINSGDTELKLYTIYAPSEHPAGTIHEVKP